MSDKPETIPTVLQFFPTSSAPGLTERLKATATSVRHVAVFALAAERPATAALKHWLDSGADLWIVGGPHLPAASLAPLLDEPVRQRLSSLRWGDLWARSGATGRAVVVKLRRNTPAIPLPWRFRLYAARRRRPAAVSQMATAGERSGRRAGSLYDRLCDKALLRASWLRVNQGRADSHGVDGVTISRFKTEVDAELDALVEELESRQYRARPLRKVLIPKPQGGHRQLRISCVRDRVVQTACLSVMEPIFEPAFSHFSFAFRPRRSAHHAVALARSFIAAGREWAVIADIERCFDTIDHDVLLDRVARRASDPLLLALLRHWLSADVLDFHDLVPSDLGVPQGSPISPLLANIYLDPLDRHFEEERVDFARYADDIVIFTRDEPAALEALHGLGAFLHEPLHLRLKPAKTHHIRISDGLDFLGFRLAGATAAIQPEKVDRVTSALHASVTALGAPQGSFLERTRTLSRINALIRGFRAYFALADEPAIASQFRHLDRAVDTFAQEALPTPLREDPAWRSRERFSSGSSEDEDESTRPAHNVYPEERAARAPLSWMVKPDNRPEIKMPPSPPASRSSNSEADGVTAPSPSEIIEHDGRVYVTSHGSYVTESGGALVVKRRRVEVYRRPLDQLSVVFLQGLGTSVSLSLALECARRDVAVVVAPQIGAPVAVLNPIDSTRSHLRGRQVLRRNDPDVVRAGLRMLAAKMGNQASILRYFAKYRVRTDVDLHKRLVTAGGEIRGLANRLGQINPAAAGVRATAMGFEGHGAAIYWAQLVALLPSGLGFKGRVTRDAGDPVNQAINYVYGMLYGEVWRALVKAGLDPYFGIMHGSERDQGSLVFDLIEEFRAPFADRLVVALLGRGLKLDASEGDALRPRVRRVLARAFIRAWTTKIRWRGRSVAPSAILEQQAGALVKLINGSADYRPFRMRW